MTQPHQFVTSFRSQAERFISADGAESLGHSGHCSFTGWHFPGHWPVLVSRRPRLPGVFVELSSSRPQGTWSMFTWLRTRDGGCAQRGEHYPELEPTQSREAAGRPLTAMRKAGRQGLLRVLVPGHMAKHGAGLESWPRVTRPWDGCLEPLQSRLSSGEHSFPCCPLSHPSSPALFCFLPEWPEFCGDLRLFLVTALPQGGPLSPRRKGTNLNALSYRGPCHAPGPH